MEKREIIPRTFVLEEGANSITDGEVSCSSDDVFAVWLSHEDPVRVLHHAEVCPKAGLGRQLGGPCQRSGAMLGSDDIMGIEERVDVARLQSDGATGHGQSSMVSRSGQNLKVEESKERDEESDEVSERGHSENGQKKNDRGNWCPNAYSTWAER